VRPLLSEEALDLLGLGLPVVIDGALGAGAAAAAAALERLSAGCRPARVGTGGRLRADPAVRGDALRWIEPADATEEPAITPLLTLFSALRAEMAFGLRLGLQRYSLQLAHFPPGGAGYRRHQDQHPGGPNRVATAIWYANPGWGPADGGALRVWLPAGAPVPAPLRPAPPDADTAPDEQAADLWPALDRLVVFLSEGLPHAVLPAARPRRALTAWYHGREDVPMLPDADLGG
jgi:SM-20-related protein